MGEWIGSITALALGVIFIFIGLPLLRGNVKPNRWYGYRVKATMNHPTVWYPVNARAGRHLIAIGLVSIAIGVVGLLWAGDEKSQALVVWADVAWIMVAIVWSAVVCVRMANRMAAALPSTAESG